MRQYRLLPYITGIFTATLLIANVLDNKLFTVAGLTLPAGIVVFPLAYLAGDVLTEVYGYDVSRSVIWTGFFALLLLVASVWLASWLPVASIWPHQAEFDLVLGRVPRIVLASILAYFSGEFVNALVLARMKIVTEGRGMPFRFVLSTMAGQGVDTVLFVLIAFTGVIPFSAIPSLVLSAWLVKVGWEVIALPITIPLVARIKRIENEDYFDHNTNFSPFARAMRTSSEPTRS